LDGPAPPMSIAVVPSATDGRDWQPAYLTRAVNVWEDGIHARLLFDNVEKYLISRGSLSRENYLTNSRASGVR